MRLLRILKLHFIILPKCKNNNIFFFFPSLHLGGAETVHCDILEVFKNNNTVCFITGFSSNDFNKNRFKDHTKLFDIYSILKVSKLYKISIKKIAKVINNSNNPIVFSSNSHFFYDLIPFLYSKFKIIDLIHAFSPEENSATEKVSLKVVERINNRVVLGEKTKNDFNELYLNANKDLTLLNRIKIIKNKVNIPKNVSIKNFSQPLVILFVGRDSYEKRPSLFFDIANECFKLNLDSTFKVIGDNFKGYNLTNNIQIIGPIKCKKTLNEFYNEASLILITSSREGFPMVILEAMAFNVVPISTNVGEISEFINEKNRNGFLIENGVDEQKIVANFVEKIIFLKNNIEILEEYSSNTYSSLNTKFSPLSFENAYKNLFFNVDFF